MADRFNKLDNTAPVVDPLNNPEINVPRSAFNLSCMKYFNGLIGAIMPFDVIRTLPNSTYNISYDVLCKLRNPLVRPLLSGMRIYLHTYYNRDSDLWEGANNFYTKGRSGNITMSKPKFKTGLSAQVGEFSSLTCFSPTSFMGIPTEYYNPDPLKNIVPVLKDSNYKVNNSIPEFDALPLVMYQRLYRDKYVNKNLIQDNKYYLPDNEDHFILPYECERANFLNYDTPLVTSIISNDKIGIISNSSSKFYVPSNSNSDSILDNVYLNAIRYRMFKGDYFTSALPFPDLIRGTAPTINVSDISATINWDNVLNTNFDSSTSFPVYANGTDRTLGCQQDFMSNALKSALNKATINGTASGVLNLNDFRALEAYTIFMERNARTDGDYDSLIKAQFGYNPHTGNREAIYVGGSYQDLVFSDVTQTSQSTEDSPMGSRVGQGISANSGYIGKFNSPDYGYLMTVMTIVPDTIYTQELDRSWTSINQADQYYPILNNLSPQPILNKELFVSGDNTTDNDVFGYTERFSEFKSRRSRSMGLISLPHSKATYDASSIMARRFTTTPTLSNDFMTMSPKNIDMSIFSVNDEPPFDLSVACRCDAVLPMPYVTVPGGLNARA